MFSSLTDLMPKDAGGGDDDDSDKKTTATPNSISKEILEQVLDEM